MKTKGLNSAGMQHNEREVRLHARIEAMTEAAEHLRQDWTNDPVEKMEGLKIADWLDKKARHQAVEWTARRREPK